MKSNYIFIAVSLIVLSFAGCMPMNNQTIDEEIEELKNTEWELIRPKDLEGSIQFNEDLTRVSGYNGCNNYTGDLIVKNYQIEISRFVSTEMYCNENADIEKEFMFRLSRIQDYSRTKQRLSLNDNTENLLVFELKE